MLISIDHGNKQIKTIHHAPFTSGLVSSRTEPFNGETLQYQGTYYALSNQRIPYRRDKTDDDRFFILTLFAIAYELQHAALNHAGIIHIQLAVGLPPAHYGAQQAKFSAYFLNRGPIQFVFQGIEYNILIDEVSCYPQSYAAAVTVFQTLQNSPRALIVDIGGFTADYLQLCNGRADLNICDSLENGVILLYNKIRSKVAAELDLLLDETEIDAVLLGQPTAQSDMVQQIILEQAQAFANDLLSDLRERKLELKSGHIVFSGGGALLLRRQIEASGKVIHPVFIDDVAANVRGFQLLYQAERLGHNGR